MRELTLSSSSTSPRPPLLLPPGRCATAGAAGRCLCPPVSRRHARGSSLSSSAPAFTRLQPLLAQRRPAGTNRTENPEELIEDLIKKHGKVIYKRNDSRPSEEAEDDAACLSFAIRLAKVADDVKAADVQVLFVKPLVTWTSVFVLATAFSLPQIDAIGSKMRDLAEKQFDKIATGDFRPNSWTLLDFDDVVVHIFLPQTRAFYNLEEFYGNAIPVQLPFVTETAVPFRN